MRGAIVAGFLCASATLWPALGAQSASSPDFSPNDGVGWIAFRAQFLPPLSGPGPVTNDRAHPPVSGDDFRATGRQPTFPVADLDNPILQPWAKEELRKRNEWILSGKPGFSRQVSCWPMGVPGFLLYPVQPVYFIQSPREVVMVWQSDHQIRHVYLTDKHSARVRPSWYGESIGHYEGDTLIVDTIGLDTRTFIDNYQTPHTDRLHVVERFHMTDGGKILEVNVHVEDPGAFTTPWDAIQRYRRSEPAKAGKVPIEAQSDGGTSSAGEPGPLIESSCAENNVSYFGNDAYPMPQADKPDF
jgi:hypothetical protein